MHPLTRLSALLLLALLAVLPGCGSVQTPSPGRSTKEAVERDAAQVPRPMPGSDTTTPHRYSQEEVGTAIVQDVRDGYILFDFTPDAGATEPGQRVKTAEIGHLQGAVIEPTVRLRLKLVRHYLQLGTTTPRQIGRSWELMRTQ